MQAFEPNSSHLNSIISKYICLTKEVLSNTKNVQTSLLQVAHQCCTWSQQNLRTPWANGWSMKHQYTYSPVHLIEVNFQAKASNSHHNVASAVKIVSSMKIVATKTLALPIPWHVNLFLKLTDHYLFKEKTRPRIAHYHFSEACCCTMSFLGLDFLTFLFTFSSSRVSYRSTWCLSGSCAQPWQTRILK
jgi:hypothetical protein